VNVVTHSALARRRRRQAVALSLGGMATLVAGLIFNLYYAFAPAFVALVAGTVMSWAGMVLADRWVAAPRADRALAEGLRDRGGRVFGLYHWVLPAEHVLRAPWGLTVFAVFNHDDRVLIRGDRWRDGRPLWRRLFQWARRPVRHPGAVLADEVAALRRALAAEDAALAEVPIDTVAVFTHPRVDLRAEAPDLPVLRAGDLGEWIRAAMKRPRLPADRQRRLEQALDRLAAARLGEK